MSSEGQRSATPRASHDDSAERSDTSRSLAPDRTGRSGQQAAHRGIYWPPTDVLRKERPTEVPLPMGKPVSIALSQTTADELQEKKSYSEGSRALPPPPSSVVPPSMLGSSANVSSTAFPRDAVVGSDQGSGSVITRDVGNRIPRDSPSEKRISESPHVSSSTDSWRPSLGEGSRGLPPPPSSTVFTNKQEILLVAPPTYEVQSSTVFSHEPSGVPFAQHGSSQPRASTGISYDIIRTSTSSGQLQQKSDVPMGQYYNLDHQSHNGMSHVDEMKPSHTNPTSKIYKSLNQGTSNDMTRSVWNPPPLNQNLDPEGPPPPVHDATGNMAPRGDAPLKTPLPLHSRVKSKSHGGKIDPSQVIPFRKITLWYV